MISRRLKHTVKQLVRRLGYEVVGRSALLTVAGLRASLIEALSVSVVLDVGANTGQFAIALREMGYVGRIISFEPLSSAFDKLRTTASLDGRWQVLNTALGDTDGVVEINIAGNSQSSSILSMMRTHSDAAPESSYIGSERVKAARLDSLWSDLKIDKQGVFLKIDTQGFEPQVIAGAVASLSRVAMIQLEVSLTHLYEGDVLFSDLYATLRRFGYHLIALEPAFVDPDSGVLLQGDAIFVRPHGHSQVVPPHHEVR
jgi:FkbM family methyltransferase